MKHFIYKALLFLFLLIVADIATYKLGDYLRLNAPSGRTQKLRYIMDEMNQDMLIMGSSRCVHHYVPDIVSNINGVSSYNTGDNGNGIIMCYGFLNGCLARYSPKIVVLDLYAPNDCELNDNVRYLSNLRPYYERLGMKEIFRKVDYTEAIKCISSLYRLNGKLPGLLNDNLSGEPFIEGGYVPLLTNIQKTAQETPAVPYVAKPIDEIKLYFLEEFCKKCNERGITLVFSRSPMYHGATKKELEPAILIADKYHIPFIDYANDERFVGHPEFFADRTHLNHTGAQAYSHIFAQDLKSILNAKGVLNK